MTSTHRPGRPDLLGRSAEVAAVEAALERCPAGGSCLLLVGDPGIGKSALLRAAVDLADARGMAVLPAAGVEAEAPLPFAGLHQLLRPLLDDVDALPDAHRAALRRAFGGAEDGARPELFLVALAALGLLDRAAERRPLLVAVDDLQWLDEPSHRVLAFVARRIEHDPIVLLGTIRTGSGGPLVEADLPVLEVGPLDDAAAHAVLARHGEHLGPADRRRILQTARGNPLALVELPLAVDRGAAARTPVELPITRRLERTFAGRVHELGRAQRDLLLVASLDAHDDLGEVVAATSALSGGPVAPGVLDVVVESGLLDVEGSRTRFRHPLVRSAVVRAEPTVRRRAAHAALATVLRDQPFRRSWHRAQAVDGVDDELADELERDHRWALSRGLGESVIWTLERAAELTSDPARRGRRLLLAAELAFELGRAETVDRLLAAAARYPLAAVERARMAWLSEVFHDGVPGDTARIRQLCAAAGDAVQAGEPDLALNLLRGAALRCWWAVSPSEVRREVVEAARMRPELARDPRYASVLAIADPISQCAPVLRLLDAAPVDGTTDAEVLRYHADAAHAVGDCARAGDLLDRAEPALRDQSRLALLQHVLDMQIQDRIELGDWGRAASAAEESRRLAPETGQPIWEAGSLVGRARLAALRGDGAAAVAFAARAEEIAHQRRLTNILACAQLARGTALCAAGRYADAYRALRRLFDPGDPIFDPRERFGAVVHLVDAAIRCGQHDDARAVLADLEQVAAVAPAPLLAVQLLHARAALADDADAAPLWAAAREADLVRWPWMRARIELAHGTWLRRQRRVVESREPLRAALATLRTIGAGPWAAEAAAELRAAGDADSLPAVADDRSPLTAREATVARLAAEGHANREIAQRLHLSHRTVGAHLRSIYAKLGVTSRAQLRDALDEP